MKTGIEDFLHDIDNGFKDKNENEQNMIFALIAVMIFAASYLLFWESAEAGYKTAEQNVINKQGEIDKLQLFLNKNNPNFIAKLDKQIAKAKKDTITYTENNAYIKVKIESISELVYDEVAWGQFLHSVSVSAKKHSVKLLNFTNKIAPPSDKFGYILDINIDSASKYKNVLRFIDDIERSNLVVDLHHLTLKAGDMEKKSERKRVMTNLKISVWGLTY